MGLVEFLVMVLVVVVLAWLVIWLMGQLAPGHPAIIDRIIWIVVVFVILIVLLRALGLLSYDPQIPRLR